MAERDPALINNLRSMARAGATVPELVRELIRSLGPETPHVLTLAKYLREAFGLTLLDVKPLSGWLVDGTGELSDFQLNEFILPEIQRHRSEWDQMVRTDL